MKILEKIKALRNKDIPIGEIEQLLLSGKLGKIRIGPNSYQYVENFALSHLIVEVHEPGFIRRMRNRPYAKVVHHIDGNKLNNVYVNLQVMSWSDHIRLHRIDPKFIKDERIRREKTSETMKAYHTNPANKEDIKTSGKAISKSLVAYFANPDNKEDIEAKAKAISKTKRKDWITPDSDPEFFENWFTIKDYAKASKVDYYTAWHRLRTLLQSKEIIQKNKLINGNQCNVYIRKNK